MALLPITIERFVAIVLPFKLTKLLCKRNCVILCVLFWLPNVIFLITEMTCYFVNKSYMLQVYVTVHVTVHVTAICYRYMLQTTAHVTATDICYRLQ